METKKLFLIFIGIRLLDLASTYACLALAGMDASIEFNPVSRYLMELVGFCWFPFVNMVLSLVLYFVLSLLGEWALITFIATSLIIFLSNVATFIICYMIIYQ